MNATRALLLASLLAASRLVIAETLSNAEETFLRGFFDHQWLAISYHQLALNSGSSDSVRRFAQSELDMYRSLGSAMEAINRKFGLIEIPVSADTPTPTLSEGVTRGLSALPEGSSWASVSVLGSLAGRGRLDRNTNALVNDTAALEQLGGEQFDQQYLLRVIMLHQRMLRHTLRELRPSGGNAEIQAFATMALAALNQQNETAEALYNGRPIRTGPPPAP